MNRDTAQWIGFTAAVIVATLAVFAIGWTAGRHPTTGPTAEMCALITQPHTPVPDQRCDSPGVGRWQLITTP